MTSAQFARWLKHMGLTKTAAGELLGVNRRTVEKYADILRCKKVPHTVELACAALALGVREYRGPPKP